VANKLKVSAPSKVILIGEHYVVYGAPSLAFAVDRYNHITFEEVDGETRFEGINPGYGNFAIYPDGRYKNSLGRDEMRMYTKIYLRILDKTGMNKAYRGTWSSDGVIKGMGASASFSAAFAYGLYKMNGVEPDEDELFECAQLGDEFAHGGRPSGIDARTVVSGSGIIFRKEFPKQYIFEKIDVKFPKGTGLLIVDTFKGRRSNTGDLVRQFAERHNINVAPNDMTEDDRRRVYLPYLNIYKKVLNELNINGNPELLGRLFTQNHELLKRAGMSTEDIENVISIAKSSNALGGKLTGAGGEGGAVIIYMHDHDLHNIQSALKDAGYDSFQISPASHGVVGVAGE